LFKYCALLYSGRWRTASSHNRNEGKPPQLIGFKSFEVRKSTCPPHIFPFLYYLAFYDPTKAKSGLAPWLIVPLVLIRAKTVLPFDPIDGTYERAA
jgi:hypothetical protein